MTGNDKPYEVGKGKPPKHSQFKPGQVANPGGKSSLQATLERRNAEAAMRIRARALHAIEAKLTECSTEEAIEMLVEAAMLKLLKDSEDRGLGAPVQAVDHSSKDGTMTPRDTSDAVIEALRAKHGPKPD
jgi:hypothetical protein